MATTIKYPLGLRTVLLSGHSRSQPATFTVSEPLSGPPYVKYGSMDVPVMWSVTFRFKGDDAMIFRLWFTQSIQQGRLPFLMDIQTEFGAITHECRFLPDSLMNMTPDSRDVFTYTATMMARQLIIPDIYPPGIPDMPDIFRQRNILDVAINCYWPKSGG